MAESDDLLEKESRIKRAKSAPTSLASAVARKRGSQAAPRSRGGWRGRPVNAQGEHRPGFLRGQSRGPAAGPKNDPKSGRASPNHRANSLVDKLTASETNELKWNVRCLPHETFLKPLNFLFDMYARFSAGRAAENCSLFSAARGRRAVPSSDCRVGGTYPFYAKHLLSKRIRFCCSDLFCM